MGKILRVMCAIALVMLLTACAGVGGSPGRQWVEQALSIQLSQTQKLLTQQLRLDPQSTKSKINHISITERTPLEIGELPSYRVRGTYDYTVTLPTRTVTQRQNPFEVYLQRQQEGKTWRLARQKPGEDGEPIWVTQRITF